MSENKPDGLGEPLDSPPGEEEGDDQDAKQGAEAEVVTQVDFQTTEELDETDHEDDD